MPFLVDSNVLIDVSRGNTAAIKYVDGLPEPWVLSQVTAMELIVGARDKRDLVTIDNFLSLYPVVPLSERIGARAYQLLKSYAKSHGLHVFDSLIAATAMENALTLITRACWKEMMPTRSSRTILFILATDSQPGGDACLAAIP